MKLKKIYICSKCGASHYKWQGQCSECGQWNTLIEEVIEEKTKTARKKAIVDFSTQSYRLKDIKTEDAQKIATDIEEFDRVLSGGVVKGQIILIGGVPGIGKSTLVLEIADKLASKDMEVFYVSGEESPQQISLRAKRIGISNNKITIASQTDISEIIKEVNIINPQILIIDSIQTLYHPQFPSSSSSPIQIRECTSELIKIAKTKNITVFILGHVTKEGELAGPKLLEHMVDTVLYFESEKSGEYRILRTFKNRFGNIDEIGIFEMTEKGIISSNSYTKQMIDDAAISGKTYTAIYEGSRAMIIRVESLVSRSFYPYPKRIFSSIDSNYAQILLASIEKNTPLKFDSYDVYINIHSGFKTKDRSIDLSVCAGIISSIKDILIDNQTAFIGEVGMLGQVYPSNYTSKRIIELERNGFNKIFISSRIRETINSKVQIIKISDISSLYKNLVEKAKI
ncbi:MAG: DNA repair protein RadA [Elusimicrobiota bacterium]